MTRTTITLGLLLLLLLSVVTSADRKIKQQQRNINKNLKLQQQRGLGDLLGGVGDLVGDIVGDVTGLLDDLLNGLLVRDCGGILGVLPDILNVVVGDVVDLVHDVVTDVEVILDDVVGAVFALTDELLGNRIVVFPRLANGTISTNGNFFATGGLGAGRTGTVQMGSQHSIAISSNGDRLFVVNPGSNSVSCFAILPNFSLKLLAVVDSGGEFPIALALSANDRTLFVLNAGGQGRLAAIDVSAFLHLSLSLPPLLDIDATLALNLGLLGRAPISVINLNQGSSSPAGSATSSPGCTNITALSDFVLSPDGNWVLLANRVTGSIISIRLNAGLFLPIPLGLPIVTNLLNLGLAANIHANILGINLDVDAALALNIGPGINLGLALGVGATVAPLSLSFAGAATLLVGVGGGISGLVTFAFDASTGQIVVLNNQTAMTGGSGGSGGSGATSGGSGGSGAASGGSGGSGGNAGMGSVVINNGQNVIIHPVGLLGLGGLLAGVLNLVDGVLVVVDHAVDNLLDDVVVLVDHLLYDVVATVDGLIYALGLGGILCGFRHDAATGTFTPCNCANPNPLLQGLAVL